MFFLDIDPREETQASLIEQVRSKLQAAYVQAKHVNRASLQTIADKLGVNKSVIHRQLSGEINLTLKTVADLSWAMDKIPSFDLHCATSLAAKNTSSTFGDMNLSQFDTIASSATARKNGTVVFTSRDAKAVEIA